MPGGSVSQFRYIAEMGEAGFVVSPIVQNTTDFLALELPGRKEYFNINDRWPQSISVLGEGAARWLWSARLSVQLFRMEIPTQRQTHSLISIQKVSFEAEEAQTTKLRETNDCAIDRINGHSGDKPPATIKGFLLVKGWAAISVNDSAAPDKTRITLTGRNGDAHSVIAKIIARDDVNQYFKKPEMGKIGYEVLADISQLAGDFTLGIEVSANGEKRACPQRLPISIVSGDADEE